MLRGTETERFVQYVTKCADGRYLDFEKLTIALERRGI
jgi:hypothetical protein